MRATTTTVSRRTLRRGLRRSPAAAGCPATTTTPKSDSCFELDVRGVLQRRWPPRTQTSTPTGTGGVYVDMAVTADAVRAAVAALPTPRGVSDVQVDCGTVTDIFGCRIAVDLTGTFDERTEGLAIARRYAEQLSLALGVPVFPLYDLLRRDHLLPQLLELFGGVVVHPAISAAPVVQRRRRHLKLGGDLLASLAFDSQLICPAQVAHDVLRGMPLPTSHVFHRPFQPFLGPQDSKTSRTHSPGTRQSDGGARGLCDARRYGE